MPFIAPFEEKDPRPTDPLRLLPKKLQTLIMVYKAGVESGLIQPGERASEPEPAADGEAADLG